MKYALLFVETDDFIEKQRRMNDNVRDRAFELVDMWFTRYAGKIQRARRLQPVHTATTVRLGEGGPVISDGPFANGSQVSGIIEIDVTHLDEALAMVRTWQGCPIVEIRPLEL